MAKSLKDQLLEAGLGNRQKAHQAEQQQRKQARQQGQQRAVEAARQQAERAQTEKAARDRELNQKRELAAARKALAAQVNQLVEAHRIDVSGGDEPYRFVHQGVIKSFYARPEQHEGLARGSLALVRYRRAYALVDRATAEKVAERDPTALALLHDPAAASPALDDEYAAFQVPDDLKW